MDRRQYTIVAVIGLLAAFIGGGIALVATGGDDEQSIRTDVTTTSSSSTLPTSTLAPATSPPVTAAPPIPPQSVAPGTAVTTPAPTIPPTTRATTTTRAPATTTTTAERGGSDTGISGTEIHLAVIADDPATFQGMTAWMTSVNKRGGIADRDVRLDLLETGRSAAGYAAAIAACDQDFAIVGSFSDFDGAPVDCAAIPDVPVEAVSPDHGAAPSTYAAFPRNSLTEAVGPYRWMLANVENCCTPFTLVPTTEPGRSRTQSAVFGAQAAGFDSGDTVDVDASDGPDRYAEIIADIESAGSTFAASGLGPSSTVLLRQAAVDGASDVAAWYCDAACYDGAFLTGGGAAVEGQLVGIETTPLTDKDEVDTLRSYLRVTKKAGAAATYAGLRAYVAGLLFEDASRSVVQEFGDDGLTRVRLLDALVGTHAFDAGGIVGATDVGAQTPTGCSVLLRVEGGKFVRVNPSAKGSLDCAADNIVTVGP